MDRQQRDDVRAIQQMTRWVLVTLQNAERGLLPSNVLQQAVDPRVLEAMGPFAPPPRGTTMAKPRVGRLRVQLVHDGLAHVACVAPRPDGTPAGYVLEFRKPDGKEAWRITELTRAEEHRLVGPTPPKVEVEQESDNDQESRRLPEDLTGLLATTRQARAEATASLERARTQLRQLPDPLPGMKTNTVAQRLKRDPHLHERAQARRDIAGWRKALMAIDLELKELHEVHEAREIRNRVLEGDPLMRVRKWDHLDRLLGPVPKDPDERALWRQAASTIETYRDRWHVTHPHQALGELPADAPPAQRSHHHAAAEAAEAYTASREPTPRRTQEAAEDLELSL